MSEKPKKKKKKVLIIVLVIIVVLAAIIGTIVKNMTKQVAAITNIVEVEPVQVRDLSDTISLNGTIAGISSTNVTSTAVSEITAMNVQAGDIVKEGDLLCTLDSTTIEEKIAELEKSISNASAVNSINTQETQKAVDQAREDQARQLEDAQKAIEQAKENFNGTQALYDAAPEGSKDFPSLLAAKRAVESAEDAYEAVLESTNRAIENAQTSLELDQYKDTDKTSRDTLNDLRKQLEDCNVVAPCGGVVTAVNVHVGDINAEKVTILSIEDTSTLKVVANVNEADILKIQEGMNTIVTSDATGDTQISGSVTRVVRVKSQGSENASGGYSVEITIDNNELLVGMAATAKVMIKEKGEVLAIPYDLIQTDADGKSFVYVADKKEDGSATAVKKNIEVGEEVDYYTEITGGDLKEGDNLIYDYTYTVTEGQTFTAEQMYSGQNFGGQAGAVGTDVEVVE